MKTGADIGRDMLLQAKKCQEPTTVRRGKEGFSCRGFDGDVALITPWFWTSAFQNRERIYLCCFKPPSVWQIATAALVNEYSYQMIKFMCILSPKWSSYRNKILRYRFNKLSVKSVHWRFKTSLREIKDILCSWTRKLSFVKMPMFPKFNTIPVKI